MSAFMYGSVCSGIEAATVAWHPLGWRPSFFSEIEAFPRAVLAHHYPNVPCHGDFTTISAGDYQPIDLLVGGTPCQSFSVAGLRKGLDDPRGNLMLGFGALAERLRPRWLVWENVPGCLSSNAGRDFGTFLGMLGIIGYGFAYRVLDAQHFGVPQRRRRVFVVGHLGDWRPAAAVLFERHSLQGHPAPRREARKVAPTLPSRRTSGGGMGTDFDCDGGLIASTGEISHCLNAGGMGRQDYETETLVTHTLRGEGFDASEDGTGRGTPLVPVQVPSRHCPLCGAPVMRNDGWRRGWCGAEHGLDGRPLAFDTTQITSAANRSNPKPGDPCHPLAAGAHPPAIAFSCKDHGADAGDIAPTLRAMGHGASHANAGGQVAVAFAPEVAGTMVARSSRGGGQTDSPGHQADQQCIATGSAVRRLTPTECERLQGFPDGYTLIPVRGKPAADGPRYKALGNSMAVPVMAWIGERIQQVDSLISSGVQS